MSEQPLEKHTEVHNIGTLAAKSRLLAAQLPDCYRPALEDHEQRLREAQEDYLVNPGYGKCASEGCDTITLDTHCGQCQEEMQGTPVSLPAWVWGIWMGLSVGAIYTIVLIGQGIDWSYAKHLAHLL